MFFLNFLKFSKISKIFLKKKMLSKNSLEQQSCPIHSVQIHGLKYTSTALVEPLLQPILQSTSLSDILFQSQKVCAQLEDLGIFRNISLHVDHHQPSNEWDTLGVEVHIQVEELPRLKAQAKTGAQGQEGFMVISTFFFLFFLKKKQFEIKKEYRNSLELYEMLWVKLKVYKPVYRMVLNPMWERNGRLPAFYFLSCLVNL
jgi:hypothetical protein